ncbi:MAG: glycoside hydrolase family 3 N-terminal domain-containing protein [Steroidobacteraceae bacterium]
MTLAEKLGQLTMTAAGHAVTGPVIAGDSVEALRTGTVGNVLNLIGADHVHSWQRLAVEESRLHIPVLFALDILHGYRTLFPIPLAEAGLFDPASWAATARATAAEAAADGIALTFAPMLDIARDPRWGRMAEGPGEDPWVGRRMAEAKVRGFQGESLAAADTLAATAKHFVGYAAVIAGREYAALELSERTLREVHLPPFAAAAQAGVAAVMPAFTDLGGLPLTAHRPLLRDTLREQLGFDGVLVSDYNAVAELIQHGIAADETEAAALALKAGIDIDMMAGAYRRGLPIALKRGLVTLGDIDESVRRVLRLKERLGLFEDPFRRGSQSEPAAARIERRRLAREVAARAIVMLTNTRETLPLDPAPKRLAVLGPLADVSAQMRGPWWAAAPPEGHVTVVEGLRAALPAAQIRHAPGVAIEDADPGGMAPALALCDGADVVLLCLGEAATLSGEAASRAHLDLPGAQRAFAEAVLERAHARGMRVVAILFSGRPLVVPWLIARADAVLAAWFLGSEAGHALADVMTGRRSPSGRTAITWPRAMGQIPLFHAERPSGRPFASDDRYTTRYVDESNEPLFPFGHGLTYGRFTLSELRLAPAAATELDTIEAQVEVTNEGPRRATETVFLFIRDTVASVTRPLLELKAFGSVTLAPGERATVTLAVPAGELRFLGRDLQPTFEPGEIEVLVGPVADRKRLLTATLTALRSANAPGR